MYILTRPSSMDSKKGDQSSDFAGLLFADQDRDPFTQFTNFVDLDLVEAGGIEPPSEDLPMMATTRLVRDF